MNRSELSTNQNRRRGFAMIWLAQTQYLLQNKYSFLSFSEVERILLKFF